MATLQAGAASLPAPRRQRNEAVGERNGSAGRTGSAARTRFARPAADTKKIHFRLPDVEEFENLPVPWTKKPD